MPTDDLEKKDCWGIPVGIGITELENKINYSGFKFTHAQMDLRHINFGTLPSGEYKKKSRSDYTKDEVVLFLQLLNGLAKDAPDYIFEDENGKAYRYKERVSSPVVRTKGVEYLLVFDVYENFNDVLISITLFNEDKS